MPELEVLRRLTLDALRADGCDCDVRVVASVDRVDVPGVGTVELPAIDVEHVNGCAFEARAHAARN